MTVTLRGIPAAIIDPSVTGSMGTSHAQSLIGTAQKCLTTSPTDWGPFGAGPCLITWGTVAVAAFFILFGGSKR